MTTAQIEAGRELDALVAVEVMGYVPCTNAKAHPGGQTIAECVAFPDSPDQGGETELYSTTGDGMLAVLERMRARGWRVSIADGWDVVFDRLVMDGFTSESASAATLPHAVCLAALEAVRA